MNINLQEIEEDSKVVVANIFGTNSGGGFKRRANIFFLVLLPLSSQLRRNLRRGFRRMYSNPVAIAGDSVAIATATPDIATGLLYMRRQPRRNWRRNYDDSGSKTKKKILALLFNPPPLSNLVAR